ncbi:unnamed protein product, partial [Choristocarpus tenellus]
RGGGEGGEGGKNTKHDVKKEQLSKEESDRGIFKQFEGIGILMLDVWGNQPWGLGELRIEEESKEEDGGEGGGRSGYEPTPLLSKRQEKMLRKAMATPSMTSLVVCSGTPMVSEPMVHPKAPAESSERQKEREKYLKKIKKELKKQGKKGRAEIKRIEKEEKTPKLAMLSPSEVGPMSDFYDEKRPEFHWSYHAPFLQDLLESLFDWAFHGDVQHKDEEGLPIKRDVVLLCAGTRSGVRTVIEDHQTGGKITQLCVGPISDATTPCPWMLLPGTIGDRITFTHYPIVTSEPERVSSSEGRRDGERVESGVQGVRGSGLCLFHHQPSFGLLNVISEPRSARIEPFLVYRGGGKHVADPVDTSVRVQGLDTAPGASPALGSGLGSEAAGEETSCGGSVILGPVVGKVDVLPRGEGNRESCRVPILLEVDTPGTVTCLMRDVLTSEEFRVERYLRARRPRSFWMQGLRSSRKYLIEFEGVVNGHDRLGYLTTPHSSFPDMVMAAVSNDRPGELPVAEINLWETLASRLKEPWHGLEVILHVGGQVDLTSAFETCGTFLSEVEDKRRQGKVSPAAEAQAMIAVKERFREEYRKIWNQPSTRQVLSSCQHLMMWGQSEACNGYSRKGALEKFGLVGRRLLRLAREVYREYQRQLWDTKWGTKLQVGLHHHEAYYTTFRWGTIGVLSLDSREIIP